MALPKIPHPTYTFFLPETKKDIKIRPFFVSEQKVLLHAIEMKDPALLSNALDNILAACVQEDISIDDLTLFDVECLILRLRAISISEIINLNYVCQNKIEDKLLNGEHLAIDPQAKEIRGPGKCETNIPTGINLNTVNTEAPKRESVIMFTDEIGISMKPLIYKQYKELAKLDPEEDDLGMETLAQSIDCVISGEEIYSKADMGKGELIEWIGELTSTDFKKIQDYLDLQPVISHVFELECPSCGSKASVKLEGLDNFLV